MVRLNRRWPEWLAMLFVLLTLVLLVVVPVLVQRRVSTLRQKIAASEPTRTLVMQWQFDLVREITALNELLLTGDTLQITTYGDAFADEIRIRDELGALSAELGPEVVAEFTEARTLASQWHARVNGEAIRQGDLSDTQGLLELEPELFQQTLTAIADIDDVVLRETAAMRSNIANTERTGIILTVILGFFALVAAGAVLAIHARVRSLAAAAESQRLETAEALGEAERQADARTRLMRGITHDVKNPLGAAKGYAELLGMEIKGPLAPEQKPLVEGIERSIDSALAIIADLLDLARADSNVAVRREEVDLPAFLRAAADDYRASSGHTGHEIEANVSDEPLVVHTDPIRVRQVLDNLVSNAVKYTPPPGRIELRARVVQDSEPPRAGEWVMLEVADSGPGIPEEHRETVFDEFSRLDESSPMKGHGLGLPTARALARQLEGDLTIEDSAQGATFVLWIPQRDAAAPRDRRQAGAPA